MQQRSTGGRRAVPRTRTERRARRRAWTAVAATLAASILASLALVGLAGSGTGTGSRAPLLGGVCWMLVVGGVTGTGMAGAGMRAGWLVLLAMQPVWIAYAVITGQLGFVLGSVAYAGGQLNGYLRSGPRPATGRRRSEIARPPECR